jgi:hypothetical protein
MIGDRLDNDIRPARSQGWNTIRILQGFAKYQLPRDPFNEADCDRGAYRGTRTAFWKDRRRLSVLKLCTQSTCDPCLAFGSTP